MIFDFEIPEIIDIEQVDGSPKPRKMNIGSEASRQEKVKITDGKPITEFQGNTNPYIDYESVDLLLSLQHPRSQGYDEMCFIVMGLVKSFDMYFLNDDLHNSCLATVEPFLMLHC